MCSLFPGLAQSKHDLSLFVGVVLNNLLYNADSLLLIHWVNILPTFVDAGCLMKIGLIIIIIIINFITDSPVQIKTNRQTRQYTQYNTI